MHHVDYTESVALMKDGQLLTMVQRQDIEGKQPDALARVLTAAYDEHCG